jgi:hypothetical protein
MSWTATFGLMLIAAAAAAQQSPPPYKFSTTVTGEPLYTFGTTVVASRGFRGDIYLLKPQTFKLPDFSRLKPVGSVYTPYLCVPARSFDEGFPGVTDRFEWFGIDYNARFWVSRPGTYRFALESDDGSNLYVDRKKIIDNDRQHAPLEKFGRVNLKSGVHNIRVSYFQGPRFHVALVLQVAGPGDNDFHVFHTDDFKPPVDAADWDTPAKPGKKN